VVVPPAVVLVIVVMVPETEVPGVVDVTVTTGVLARMAADSELAEVLSEDDKATRAEPSLPATAVESEDASPLINVTAEASTEVLAAT